MGPVRQEGGGAYVCALSRARERGGKGECAILVPYLGGRSGVNGGPVLAALAGLTLMEKGGGGGGGPGARGGGHIDRALCRAREWGGKGERVRLIPGREERRLPSPCPCR